MTATAEDLHGILQKLRYDATAMQAKITDALNMVAGLNLPSAAPRERCALCGVVLAPGRRILEHLSVVHDDFDATAKLRMLDAA